MGYGNYSQAAHDALIQSRSHLPEQQVFVQKDCHVLMNPKGVRARESRDSAVHPNTISIAFALDVTGSMGDIPKLLAKEKLPKFMQILGSCGIADPQLLFLAVGDATSDRAPLQVGQFESTAELMDQWLTWSFLEGNGGGQGTESYELALYFLAEHTTMDGWLKRKQRGYLFMTGDERPYPAVSRHQVEALIGDKLDEDIPLAEVVSAVSETFHPFFLIPDLERRAKCERVWRDVLGDYVIAMESAEDTCYVAAGALVLTEKVAADIDALAKIYETSGMPRARIAPALRALTPYADSLDKSGYAKPPALAGAALNAAASLWKRLTNTQA
jgi:hypothetical protein